ncbi:MAG TPA: nitrile hydratase subunit beta [Vicinamibacterales bacterium]|jgi:nitrile hydratase subunit beta|nr:nitrile hydratase subunit beta [Vicinamibacterales bacterium]
MNGVHDMGGMHGMGPIQLEKNEPVFHARWEARVFALNRLVGAWGKWNIDASRHVKELIPPAEYFRISYYEKFLVGMTELLVNSGLVTRAELESGKPARDSKKMSPPLTVDKVPLFVAKGVPASRNVPVEAKFRVGQRVRARNLNPTGHTRLPRYARGKPGTIERDHGVFVFPDTNAHFLGENPQHLYSVRFAARDLWGDEAAPQDAVYVNLWDSHLEPA